MGAAQHQTLQGVSPLHLSFPQNMGLVYVHTPHTHPQTWGQRQGDLYRNLLDFVHSTAEGHRQQIRQFCAYSQSPRLSKRSR